MSLPLVGTFSDFIINVYMNFLAFPQGCTTYSGSRTLPCLRSIYNSRGCLNAGLSYPDKTTSTNAQYDGMTLR